MHLPSAIQIAAFRSHEIPCVTTKTLSGPGDKGQYNRCVEKDKNRKCLESIGYEAMLAERKAA